MKKNTLTLAVMALVCAAVFSKAHAQNTSPYWSLAGNADATSASKLGTTNNADLNLYAGNMARLRISHSTGNAVIGRWSFLDARLTVNAQPGSNPFIGQINGVTKLFAASNGGLSVGSGATPPINGLYVKGNVGIGTTILDSGVKMQVPGKAFFIKVPANFGDVVTSTTNDYGVVVKSISGGIYAESVFDHTDPDSYERETGIGIGVNGKGTIGVQGIGAIGLKGIGAFGDTYGIGVYAQAGDEGKAIVASGGNVGISVRSRQTGIEASGEFTGVEGAGGWGVYGSGYGSSASDSDGIYGGNFTSSYGNGLYAQAGMSKTSYAGVFEGNVFASGVFQSSDRNLKQNVQEFQGAMSLISKLKPRNYEFKADEKLAVLHLPKGTHYGLIAQDVEEVLPNLVKEVRHNLNPFKPEDLHTKFKADSTSAVKGQQNQKFQLPAKEMLTTKAVNYIELIPIMIKGMQEQQQENDELKARVAKLEELVSRLTNGQNSNTIVSSANVEQNTPNPVSNTTSIKYHIPQAATSATLNITNAKGQLVKTIALGNSTTGQVNINTSMLAAGTYNYTLYVDGKSMDTKRLVVTH